MSEHDNSVVARTGAAHTSRQLIQEGFALILKGLGLSQDDPHLARTAERAAKAWHEELCSGLTQPPPVITTFPSDSTEMVVLRRIPVRSICAHHLLPFTGTATVAYIPNNDSILGLSKLSRLVDYWARRPQVQEELTRQIADALLTLVVDESNEGGGVGVCIRANHTCMELRGVKHPGDMVTSALRGVFTRAEVRAEFLRLATTTED